MEYGQKDGVIFIRHPVESGEVITLSATNVKQERTGIHARVSIYCNQAVLSWGLLNIERDEERVRLANSAYSHLNGLKDSFPKEWLKHDLDLFCAGLWDEAVKIDLPEELSGTSEATMPAFRIKPYILTKGGTILFAPPGRGKSYLLLLMAISMDTGRNMLFDVNRGKALFVNLERSRESVKNRIGNVNAALGLPRNRPLLTLNARGRSLMDVMPAVRRAVKENNVDCVFLDSITRAGYGDLTENKPVNAIADALNSLDREWFAIAHTPRGDETHVYGSIMFEAASDVMLSCGSQQMPNGTLGLSLKITKQNDVGPQPPQILALDFAEWGLCAARNAAVTEFPELMKVGMSMKEQVLDYLANVGPRTASQVALELDLNRGNVSFLLNNDEAFVKGEKKGREQFFDVRYDA